MKLNYINSFYRNGFTEQEKADLRAGLKDVQTALETKFDTKLNERLTDNEKAMQENQKAIDQLLILMKDRNGSLNIGKKTFGEAFADEVKNNFELLSSTKRPKSVIIELKTVGDMTTSASLTGDGQATYSNRQGLVPSPIYNFRDLVPTTPSETGTYVHFNETGGEGGVDIQTEGSAKSQIDFDFAEVKTIPRYVAGYARFSKQLMKNLPFLQNTLPRLLLRKFYEKENSYFSGIFAAGATGFNTTTETVDVFQLIDILSGRGDANFKNSFVACRYTALGRILKYLQANGYYEGSGGVVGQPDGSVRIMNTPIIPVSWVPSYDKMMIIDNDYIERVESDTLRVEFFEEDGNNVRENMITARVECLEMLNLIRTDAHSYIDMGNSASS